MNRPARLGTHRGVGLCAFRQHRPCPSRHPRRAGAAHSTSTDSALVEPLPQHINQLDAVVVLSACLEADGSLPKFVARRLDAALEVHRAAGTACKLLITGGGSPHKPSTLDAKGYVAHESTSCARYLLARGVPAGALLKEIASHDTVGNAYFSLASHVIPSGWTRLAVVTSDFHMPRARQLFTDMLAMAARELYQQPDRYELHFCAASDVGVLDPEVLRQKREKEVKGVEQWRHTWGRMHSLAELHSWLHSEHMCYSVAQQDEW